jgi:hypothetical protein
MLATHLYLVAKNDPSYRYPEKKIKEWQDDAHYASVMNTMSGN